mmetsp:Transcript_44705/g.97274  ORF Transcript_44705/g.97274 Transcript_44705/m.97274 type:complete len:422 (+) Transcript_44705:84-1349(+)
MPDAMHGGAAVWLAAFIIACAGEDTASIGGVDGWSCPASQLPEQTSLLQSFQAKAFTHQKRATQHVKRVEGQPPPPVLPPAERPDGVRSAIVFKIHGPRNLASLLQSLCLLTQAYNGVARRDVVIFSDLRLDDAEMQQLQQTAAPASIDVISMHATPQEILLTLSSSVQERVAVACNSSIELIDWETVCCEKDDHLFTYCFPMGYLIMNWFRIVELWTHPRLAAYDYILQMDSDSFCTKPWEHDPIEVLAEQNLTYCFNNELTWADNSLVRGVRALSREHFGKPTCEVKVEGGHLSLDETSCISDLDTEAILHVMWGNFQVARLAFFRAAPFQAWARRFAADGYIFTRRWDDQTALTVALAQLAPEQTWQLAGLGLDLGIFHNANLNGTKVPDFVEYVDQLHNQATFALDACRPLIKISGL